MGGRGIVICGGGRYLLCALVNIRILREHGCRLPVELWHFADEPMPWFLRRRLSRWDVTTRIIPPQPTRYASKPYALMNSRFDEVMSLDADNTPIRNPEYLFDTEEWRRTGAIFWPDYFVATPNAAWREIAKREPLAVMQQESGQLLIDKRRHRVALEKTLQLNDDYHRIAPMLWGAKGDKDTFQLGWYATRHDFHMVPLFPGGCGCLRGDVFISNTIVQFDTAGKPLFMHKNGKKWHLVRRPVAAWDSIATLRTGFDHHKLEMTLDLADGQHELRFKPLSLLDVKPATEWINDLESRCLGLVREFQSRTWFKLVALASLLSQRLSSKG